MVKVKKPNENKALTFQEEQFLIRLNRLKSAFGVESDLELAKALEITQAAISAAKKKTKIPKTWLQKVLKLGISSETIMEGTHHQRSLFGEPDSLVLPNRPIYAMATVNDNEKAKGLSVTIAKKLVELAQLVGKKDWDKDRKDALVFKIKDEMVLQCVAKIHDIDHDFELIVGNEPDLTVGLKNDD
jgi:hypothetical protein